MFKRIAIAFFCLMLPAFPAPGETPKPMSRQTTEYFSTVCMLMLYDTPDMASYYEETWQEVKQILKRIEDAVSISVPDSDVSRFNALHAGESCEISDITAEILQIAFAVHEKTGGLYDPTVYPLVDLWGFSPRFNQNTYQSALPYDRSYDHGRLPLPNSAHIQALLPLVGLQGITLLERDGVWTLRKDTPSVTIDGTSIQAQLDLGGIAKGYACDLVKAYLLERGYTHGHFVCGDSSIAVLTRPSEDGLYTLTLGKPRAGSTNTSHFASVRIRNTTLSTSSDSRHGFTRDGVRYCHIIDPRTGWPINMPKDSLRQTGVASVSLLAPSAAYSDAITTALCLMPPQEILDFTAGQLNDAHVIAVLYAADNTQLEVITTLEASRLTIEDDAYHLASTVGEGFTPTYIGSLYSQAKTEVP